MKQFSSKFPHVEAVLLLVLLVCIPYLTSGMFALRAALMSYIFFHVLMWNKTQVYFQGILQGLKDASGPLILGLALEILPCFNSKNSSVEGTASMCGNFELNYNKACYICSP